MRLLLLLSALFTALAGTSAGARVVAVPAHQTSAAVEAVSSRASLTVAGPRPAAPAFAVEPRAFSVTMAPVAPLPLYAGRLRV